MKLYLTIHFFTFFAQCNRKPLKFISIDNYLAGEVYYWLSSWDEHEQGKYVPRPMYKEGYNKIEQIKIP